MFYCVAYDIRSNKLRLKMAKICLKIGLWRVQRSIFMGRSLPRLVGDLEAAARLALLPTDRFMLLPLDEPTFEKLLFLGEKLDLKRLSAVFPAARCF